jgi:hypothetical protein
MTKKQWVIFFAGAEAFHTLSHIMLYFSDMLPFAFYSIQVTQQLNLWAVFINGIATILLLNWAKKLK